MTNSVWTEPIKTLHYKDYSDASKLSKGITYMYIILIVVKTQVFFL